MLTVQSPVFTQLKRRFPGAIRGNFGAKFLVNRKGTCGGNCLTPAHAAGDVVKRSRFSPKQLEPEIRQLLQQSA